MKPRGVALKSCSASARTFLILQAQVHNYISDSILISFNFHLFLTKLVNACRQDIAVDYLRFGEVYYY